MSAMNDEPDSSPTLVSLPPAEDEELAHVLEGFLSGLEAGRRPNAQELIKQHPALAGRLKTCLASLQFLEQAAGELSAGRMVENAEPAGGTLGDYRLLREVGRGGMGVVYEAEQISLRRRVALKVLPYSAVLDQRALARFKNEALAAAALDHPNIVPLYGIGCERSVHFYAMRFIDGPTLADCIRQLQQRQRENADIRFNSLAQVAAESSLKGEAGRLPRFVPGGASGEDPTAAYTPTAGLESPARRSSPADPAADTTPNAAGAASPVALSTRLPSFVPWRN